MQNCWVCQMFQEILIFGLFFDRSGFTVLNNDPIQSILTYLIGYIPSLKSASEISTSSSRHDVSLSAFHVSTALRSSLLSGDLERG